jgi:CotH kinase protein
VKKTLPSIIALLCSLHLFAQTLTSSNLPIFIINTEGQTIRDEPKVAAKLKVINNGIGKINNVTDETKDYNGRIGIEYRGSTSQTFPKKPYGFETWDDKNMGIDASILGFPPEQDWILFASYNEKSLLHNVLAMKLGRDLGDYTPRTQHVEVVLNGNYEGVYVFMEKIKRSANRVNISKLTATENSGDALTGGYIFKIDKTTGSGGIVGWNSVVPPSVSSKGQKTYYQVEYPKPSELTTLQLSYLKTYVDSAEAALRFNLADPLTGYRKFFDAQSFIHLFLANEISHNVDGYRISTYFHKDKHSKNRRIKAGPFWDFDLAFGNADYCDGMRTYGWAYLFGDVCPDDYWQMPFHWGRMLQDPSFANQLKTTYVAMRKGAWQTEKLHAYIDSMATVLNQPQQRNFQRWPVMGQYIWPNPRPIPATYQAEVNELKSFLTARLIWLDNNIPGYAGPITALEKPSENNGLTVTVLGNPFEDVLQLTIAAPRLMETLIEIFDAQGRPIKNIFLTLQKGSNTLSTTIAGASGVYFIKTHTALGTSTTKVLKQ